MNIERTMGLDVGDARIGVALSDPLCISAQPFCTIECRGKKHFGEILSTAHTKKVNTIVVGLPKKLDGSIGTQAEKVLAFVEDLKKAISNENNTQTGERINSILVTLWDERMTTVQAERILAGNKVKRHKRRGAVDQISASLILESYLIAQENL